MKQKVINFIDEVLNFYKPVFLHPTSYVREPAEKTFSFS